MRKFIAKKWKIIWTYLRRGCRRWFPQRFGWVRQGCADRPRSVDRGLEDGAVLFSRAARTDPGFYRLVGNYPTTSWSTWMPWARSSARASVLWSPRWPVIPHETEIYLHHTGIAVLTVTVSIGRSRVTVAE